MVSIASREGGWSMDLEFPVFVREKDSGDMRRFDSLYEMQRQLERIDIENEEYDAWDGAGAPVRLRVQQPVWLAIHRGSEPSPGELRSVLLYNAAQAGIDLPEHERLSFAELLDRVDLARKAQKPKRRRDR
jgi:hypothetical protein